MPASGPVPVSSPQPVVAPAVAAPAGRGLLLPPTNQSLLLPAPYRVTAAGLKLKLIPYARPNVGKTTLSSTAQDHPDLSPVLIANFEGGLLAVAGRGDIEAVDIKSTAALEALFWALARPDENKQYAHFKTLVIDSGSELQTLAIEEAVRARLKKRIAEKKTTPEEADPDDIWVDDYGVAQAKVKRLFRWFRDLPIHVIITAFPEIVYPKGPGGMPNRQAQPIEVKPQFMHKLSEALVGYMDHVWYYYKDDSGNRFALTTDKGPYRAKTRGIYFPRALGLVVNNPTIPSIWETYLESEAKEREFLEKHGPDALAEMAEATRAEVSRVDVTLPAVPQIEEEGTVASVVAEEFAVEPPVVESATAPAQAAPRGPITPKMTQR